MDRVALNRRAIADRIPPFADPTLQFLPQMSERTVRLHRVFRCPPERVYRAFLEPAALAKWLPPRGFTGTVHHLEARVGGTFRMTFHPFAGGPGTSFGGCYLELRPGERLRYTNQFEDVSLPGTMEVAVSLRPVSCGTEALFSQAGIPAVVPLELCHLGWQESLDQLAALVEGGPAG